jgi:hypothetical protein
MRGEKRRISPEKSSVYQCASRELAQNHRRGRTRLSRSASVIYRQLEMAIERGRLSE